MYIHCKTMVFESFEGCVRERKRYQKIIQSETNILPQINEKSMLEEVYKKHWKISKVEPRRGPESMGIPQKIIPETDIYIFFYIFIFIYS